MLSLLAVIKHGLAKKVISLKCHQMQGKDNCLQQNK